MVSGFQLIGGLSVIFQLNFLLKPKTGGPRLGDRSFRGRGGGQGFWKGWSSDGLKYVEIFLCFSELTHKTVIVFFSN